MIRRFFLVLLAYSVVSVNAAETQPDDNAQDHAQAKVEALHQALLQAMQLSEQAAREALLTPVIQQTFDLKNIARISVGRTWRKLSQEDQASFTDQLGVLVVATYADRFDSYNEQQFVTDEIKGVKTGHVVHTRIIRKNDEPVTLDYYLRGDGIFNVVADGVSDLSLRRADYNSIIKQNGFAALQAHVALKVEQARGLVDAGDSEE
ncbi:MAG: ABC transporter substrate-binding protein [Pseudomonadota bacterium]